MIKIKRALISVSNKNRIEELAKTLQEYDCEIISTGGTKKVLKNANVKVTDIQKITGSPEAFNGRMKTLSFQIGSALLFDREKDKQEADQLGIKPIDLVVCNLYPFQKAKEANTNLDELLENIDIGGPTMLRAAAKNFKYVAVVTDSADYQLIINELRDNLGSLSYDSRYFLMRKAFNHTADYDALIASTIDSKAGDASLRLHFVKGMKLRYGENSHQKGYFFREAEKEDSLFDLNILHGKKISFNNLNDIQAAIDSVKNLERFGTAVIKHGNPCGLAEADDQLTSFENAWQGDPISAFGSIIAFNKPLELTAAEFLRLNHNNKRERKFVEVIIAPDFTIEALEYLKFHKNLRIVKFDPKKFNQKLDLKFLFNSLLVQESDEKLYESLDCVTKKTINIEKEKALIKFGILAIKQVRSNSIIIVREKEDGIFQLLGMGAGQPNRLISTKLAIEKAKENLSNEYDGENFERYCKSKLGKALLFSDAFFPFPDNVELAAAEGIKKIIQPGGSIRDKKVIKKCNELGITMIFTGIRHFKH